MSGVSDDPQALAVVPAGGLPDRARRRPDDAEGHPVVRVQHGAVEIDEVEVALGHELGGPGDRQQQHPLRGNAQAPLGLLFGQVPPHRLERRGEHEAARPVDSAAGRGQRRPGLPEVDDGVARGGADPEGVVGVVDEGNRRPVVVVERQGGQDVVGLDVDDDEVGVGGEGT